MLEYLSGPNGDCLQYFDRVLCFCSFICIFSQRSLFLCCAVVEFNFVFVVKK